MSDLTIHDGGNETPRLVFTTLHSHYGNIGIPVRDAQPVVSIDGQASLRCDLGEYALSEISKPFSSLQETHQAYTSLLPFIHPLVAQCGGVPAILRTTAENVVEEEQLAHIVNEEQFYIEPLDSASVRFLDTAGFEERGRKWRSFIEKYNFGEEYVHAVSTLMDIFDNSYEVLVCVSPKGAVERPVRISALAPPPDAYLEDSLAFFPGVTEAAPPVFNPDDYIYPGLANEPPHAALQRVARAANILYQTERSIPIFDEDDHFFPFMQRLLEAHTGLPLWFSDSPEQPLGRYFTHALTTISRSMETLRKASLSSVVTPSQTPD